MELKLGYQKLLEENKIQVSDLSEETQEGIRTIQAVLRSPIIKKRGISDKMKLKIQFLDKAICTNIIDFLDDDDEEKENKDNVDKATDELKNQANNDAQKTDDNNGDNKPNSSTDTQQTQKPNVQKTHEDRVAELIEMAKTKDLISESDFVGLGFSKDYVRTLPEKLSLGERRFRKVFLRFEWAVVN